MENNTKQLTRSSSDKVIGGVCAGLAEYFNIDVTLVRALFVILALSGGTALPLYIVLWLVMPEDEEDHNRVYVRVQDNEKSKRSDA